MNSSGKKYKKELRENFQTKVRQFFHIIEFTCKKKKKSAQMLFYFNPLMTLCYDFYNE